VTIGQLGSGFADFSSDSDWAQPTVTSGTSYVSPVAGTIVSWSHQAVAGQNQQLTLKLFRKVADPTTYMAVAHDGPAPLTGGTTNSFTVSIPVQAGDVLGLNTLSPANTGALFLVPGQKFLFRASALADGESGAFTVGGSPMNLDSRLNVNAVVQPSNSFALGAIKRNRKKGTATLTVQIPNPGEISGSGKGVKATSAGAIASKTVTPPGKAKLRIAAKGKKRRKLGDTGKVKLRPRITYTPTGDDPNTLSRSLTLRKR
jgi:hypothetical protein